MSSKGKGIPRLYNINALIKAGINPLTGLPYKLTSASPNFLKEDLIRSLRIIDEQDAINKGVWYNLPCNISGQELERMLYFKGQLAFFYDEITKKFYFMPYALDGTIDFYGRYNSIHPIPMTCGTTEEEIKKEKDSVRYKNQANLLSSKKLNCIYGVVTKDELSEELLTKSCVLLHDYSKGLAQEITPRYLLNECLIKLEAECLPLMRTHLIANCGVEGVRVQDADQANSVEQASKGVESSAMNGNIYSAIVGTIDFQELTGRSGGSKAEEYMMAMQSIDNLRLSTYGLENGGLFEKKAHMLQEEQESNNANIGLVAQDYVSIRQNFCNIVNSIWGLGIRYEPSQNEIGDTDNDGLAYDDNDDGENGGIEDGNDTSIPNENI